MEDFREHFKTYTVTYLHSEWKNSFIEKRNALNKKSYRFNFTITDEHVGPAKAAAAASAVSVDKKTAGPAKTDPPKAVNPTVAPAPPQLKTAGVADPTAKAPAPTTDKKVEEKKAAAPEAKPEAAKPAAEAPAKAALEQEQEDAPADTEDI